MSNIVESERLKTINNMLAQRQQKIAGAKSLAEIEAALSEVLFEIRRTDYNDAPVIETVKSKADLKTTQAKSAYISAFGMENYLKLPAA